jgi:ubiquinone/menaquinone biosynthesis C-methylase UbiE
LAETKRVLKPGGTLRFVEHVRAEGAFGTLLDLVTPVWQRLFAGCHPNRRTVEDIRAAGFRADDLELGCLAGALPLVSGVARVPARRCR